MGLHLLRVDKIVQPSERAYDDVSIEDSASGKGVLEASAVRTALFVGVALYAWATVWMLERWRGRESVAA